MGKLWIVLALVGCAGDEAPYRHELSTCAPSPAWNLNGRPDMHIDTCEAACVNPPEYTGPGCAKAWCDTERERPLIGDCPRTFVTPEGVIGCCEPVGTIQDGFEVAFLECE